MDRQRFSKQKVTQSSRISVTMRSFNALSRISNMDKSVDYNTGRKSLSIFLFLGQTTYLALKIFSISLKSKQKTFFPSNSVIFFENVFAKIAKYSILFSFSSLLGHSTYSDFLISWLIICIAFTLSSHLHSPNKISFFSEFKAIKSISILFLSLFSLLYPSHLQ